MIAHAPWFERKFRYDFDTGMFPVIYSRLEGTIYRLQHVAGSFNENIHRPPATGWSVKEHAGHLLDLEELWWKRWDDYNNNRKELAVADLNNTKTKEARHNEKNIGDIVNDFADERRKILQV